MRNFIIAFCLLTFFAACDSADKRTTDSNDGVVKTDADRTKDNDKKDDGGLFGEKKNDNDRSVVKDDNEKNSGEDRIDQAIATAGRTIFMSQCVTCHKVSDSERKADQSDAKREIDAPDMSDITDKRNDRFLVNFMINADGTDNDNDNAANKEKDDVCLVQKPGKQLSRDKALKVLEYLHMQANKD